MEHELKALGEGGTTYSFDKPDPGVLEHFPAPSGDDQQMVVVISTSEFTSLCPKTGQPDWAEIVIRYKPAFRCVESKSLKLYLMGYRNHGEFHESCVHRILKDLRALLEPEWIVVEGHFTARGGIPFKPVAWSGMIGADELGMSLLMRGDQRQERRL